MFEKDDIDALEDLKATQEALATSFETELRKLQSQYKDLQIDHDRQKSQLIEALLSKDKLQQMITATPATDKSKIDSTDATEARTALDLARTELDESQQVSNRPPSPFFEFFSLPDGSPIPSKTASPPSPSPGPSSATKKSYEVQARPSAELNAELALFGHPRTVELQAFTSVPLTPPLRPLATAHLGGHRHSVSRAQISTQLKPLPPTPGNEGSSMRGSMFDVPRPHLSTIPRSRNEPSRASVSKPKRSSALGWMFGKRS
jgi:hypothetical protein